MNDGPRTYRTRTGRVLTDRDIEALADEAERGYDVELLGAKPGRPRMGSEPAVVVPVRLHANLREAVKTRAGRERTSVSELIRDSLRDYLASPTSAAAGRAVGAGDLQTFADEAEAGYEVSTLRSRPARRVGQRAEVVPVRMAPELKVEVERRAELEQTSVSEIVRAALRARLI